jgi:hypothetical protein
MSVFVPPVAPTGCEPDETVIVPVVPPSPTLAPVPAVAPSIWRLNRPGSRDGSSTLLTVSVPTWRRLWNTQVALVGVLPTATPAVPIPAAKEQLVPVPEAKL